MSRYTNILRQYCYIRRLISWLQSRRDTVAGKFPFSSWIRLRVILTNFLFQTKWGDEAEDEQRRELAHDRGTSPQVSCTPFIAKTMMAIPKFSTSSICPNLFRAIISNLDFDVASTYQSYQKFQEDSFQAHIIFTWRIHSWYKTSHIYGRMKKYKRISVLTTTSEEDNDKTSAKAFKLV